LSLLAEIPAEAEQAKDFFGPRVDLKPLETLDRDHLRASEHIFHVQRNHVEVVERTLQHDLVEVVSLQGHHAEVCLYLLAQLYEEHILRLDDSPGSFNFLTRVSAALRDLDAIRPWVESELLELDLLRRFVQQIIVRVTSSLEPDPEMATE
jgi:hypothetical protein